MRFFLKGFVNRAEKSPFQKLQSRLSRVLLLRFRVPHEQNSEINCAQLVEVPVSKSR